MANNIKLPLDELRPSLVSELVQVLEYDLMTYSGGDDTGLENAHRALVEYGESLDPNFRQYGRKW